MLPFLADKLTAFVTRQTHLSASEKEIYKYCLESLLNKVLYIITMIAFGFIVKQPLLAFVYLISIIPLRMFAGGAHASTKTGCLFISYSIGIVAILFLPVIGSRIPITLPILLFIVSVIPIVIYAPVDNKNKRLNKNTQNNLRKKSRIFVSFLTLSVLFLYAHKLYLYAEIIIFSVIICSINIVIGFIINRRGNAKYLRG